MRHYFLLYLLPNIIIFFHSLLSTFIYHETFYIFRNINNLIYIFSCIVFTYSLFLLHGQKALVVLLSSVFSYYFIRIIEAVAGAGPAVFLANILIPGSPLLTKWLEAHDVGLTMGLVIIYYLIFDKSKSRTRRNCLILSCIIFVLCNKRIAIGALIAVLIFRFIYHRKIDKKGKMTLVWGVCGVIICYVFVYLVSNQFILGWLWDHGINTMGRTSIYIHFRPYYDFLPSFFGRGSGFTSKLLSLKAGTEFNIGSIMALHSDILRAYIEYGFIGSGLWYTYYLIILPKKMACPKEHYSEIVFIIAMYSFVVYLTDNTSNYMLFQACYMLIPLCFWGKEEIRNKKLGNIRGICYEH